MDMLVFSLSSFPLIKCQLYLKETEVGNIYTHIHIYVFDIYLFLAAPDLCSCVQAFSSCSEQGLLFATLHQLLIIVTFSVDEHLLRAPAQ